MTPEDKAEMDAIWWWHEIEIEPGVWTQAHGKTGIRRHASSLYGIPEDLSGKDALDIGGWDGGYAFECERRGAERVVMCDVYQNAKVGQGGRGFKFAKRMLRSKVVFFPLKVGEIDRFVGTFDLVLFLGVLYHIDDMFGALCTIRSVLKDGGQCIVETAFDTDMSKEPIARWGLGTAGDNYNRWYPNRACLVRMAKDAGFSGAMAGVQECDHRGTYHLFA